MIEGELLFRRVVNKFRGGRIIAGGRRLTLYGNQISDGNGMMPRIALRIGIDADQLEIIRLNACLFSQLT